MLNFGMTTLFTITLSIELKTVAAKARCAKARPALRAAAKRDEVRASRLPRNSATGQQRNTLTVLKRRFWFRRHFHGSADCGTDQSNEGHQTFSPPVNFVFLFFHFSSNQRFRGCSFSLLGFTFVDWCFRESHVDLNPSTLNKSRDRRSCSWVGGWTREKSGGADALGPKPTP